MRAILGALYGSVVLIGGIAAALVIGTLGVLPLAVLPRGRRERRAMRAAQAWARTCLALLLCRPRVTGDSGLPADGGALYLANHRSWLDPLLLIAYTRSNGLSKAEIRRIPFVGLYGHLTGAVFFSRESRKARARARDDVLFLLRSGHRIHVFPEGTRTRDGRIRPRVFLRLAKDCHEAGIPVVPCAVYGTERALPVGRPCAFPGQPCRLDVGRALHPRDFPTADAFARACWDDVVRRVGALAAEGAVQTRPAMERAS